MDRLCCHVHLAELVSVYVLDAEQRRTPNEHKKTPDA